MYHTSGTHRFTQCAIHTHTCTLLHITPLEHPTPFTLTECRKGACIHCIWHLPAGSRGCVYVCDVRGRALS